MKTGKQMTGFTLIELMIVIAIMALLAGIAYPTYIDQIVRSNRSVATGALLELAQRQEGYFADNNTYADTLAKLVGDNVGSRLVKEGTNYFAGEGSDKLYSLSFSEVSGRSYTLKATPLGSQATRDTKCKSFTITSSGRKGIDGGSGSVSDCW